jgi:hypothetical protein
MSPPQFVWLNGRLVPSDQATVSVFDRSFLYGDGLFESIPREIAENIGPAGKSMAYRGRFDFYDRKMDRLGWIA